MKVLKIFSLLALLALPSSIGSEPSKEKTVAQMVDDPKVAEILFIGAIDEDSSRELIRALKSADQDEDVETIHLTINTPGGDFSESMVISMVMEHLHKRLVCTVDGEAYSGGFYILQSCTVREATKRSGLMAHFPWIQQVSGVNLMKLKQVGNSLSVMSHMYASHIASRMNMTEEQVFARLEQGDWWMTPAQALKVGALDRIVDNPNGPKPSHQPASQKLSLPPLR